MPDPTPEWLDAQYNNRARIPEHPAIFDKWMRASALAREGLRGRLDLRYGPGPKETLDVFEPAGTAATGDVVVFIHGGYWRSLDKSDHSFVAPVFAQAGAVVVVPNYDLCPAVGIDDIAMEMTRALAWTWHHAAEFGGDRRRVTVIGHSAGGHLAAMLMTCDWPRVDPAIPRDWLRRGMTISGLHDLRIVAQVPFLKADLRLAARVAARVSPALFPPPAGTLYALAGQHESEEFLRHTRLIQDAWGPSVVPVCDTIAGRNHLDILIDLADPDAQLHQLARELMTRT
ncbi:MAG: alpha/beta hydrolase [Ideonella sp.]|nr:alpha/beta hydrolase [Ideonella sp.]